MNVDCKARSALITLCLAMFAGGAEAQTEQEFCADGQFTPAHNASYQDLLELVIGSDDFVGEEIRVRSHILLTDQNSERISGLVGPLRNCWLSLSLALVEHSRSFDFEISITTLGVDRFGQARREVLSNTENLSSKAMFELVGEVRLYANTLEPYLHVSEILVFD